MEDCGQGFPVRINLLADQSSLTAILADEVQPNGSRLPGRTEAGRSDSSLDWSTIPDAVIITSRKGAVLDMNDTAARILGLNAPLTKGILTELLPGLSSDLLDRIVCLLSNRHAVILQGTARPIAGEEVPVDISVGFGGQGNEELCFILHDVRKHSQLKAELSRVRAHVARAERLETAGTVSGQIAHDFNNLLTPLMAYPGLIRRELAADSPAREYLNVLEKTAEDMAHMTQQLLALSRRGKVGDDVFNINSIVEHVFMLLRSEFLPDTIALESDLASDLLPLRGSSDQLLRVIQNLCQNSIDAMETGGILKVSSRNVYLERPFGNYDTVEQGEYVRVAISDNGPGIPEQIRAKIFEPFFTTKRGNQRRGSGLGLSIVHGIAMDHKGYVDLESEENFGTTFYLYLPVCREDQPPPASEDIRGQGQKILVVDDDPGQLDIIMKLLSVLGYEATGCTRGAQALERLRQNQRDCDMVILDMCLGDGMDGCATWRELAFIRPGIPSLLVSGISSSSPMVAKAQSQGAGLYLRKPLTIESLGRAIKTTFAAAVESAPPDRPAAKVCADPAALSSDSTAVAGRVLLVDDEEAIRRMFAMILKGDIPGLEIGQAGDGRKALEMFKKQPFDLVVMDLHMPVMDGRQAFIGLREHCRTQGLPLPPIIFCTGFALPDFLREVVSADGPHLLLRKPVRADALVEAVRSRLPNS